MIIAIELDRIICTPVSSSVSLNDVGKCELTENAKESLDKLKSLGHTILIYTSRDASLGPETQVWLQKNKIPYDRIICNKPNYDLLIDNKSCKFSSWTEFLDSYKYWLINCI